jgi:hypothetical protein
MADLAIRVGDETGEIPGLVAGSGGVTGMTFVAVDAAAGTATEATESGYGVGIALYDASEGKKVAVKMTGMTYLTVDATSAITAGMPLKSDATGKGEEADTDQNKYNAVALAGLASGEGPILVRLVVGERSV